ncbi:MAG: hypothetical protein CMJ84_09080 [Planctomycetes bacterium]|jgi:phosphatidylinositol alpha-1,6-mannosyltransferase|nr:hypothetical protein [Planctomycetota bacterium]MDP6410378.1 glycosyltransferase family 4 protein [Planctomycetota bacterium]
MRVLFLTDSLSDLDGVGRYAVRLIAALEQVHEGLEVEVLLARKHRPSSADVPAHWKVAVGLPPDYFFYMSPLRFWCSLLASLPGVWRAARRADLVHAIKDYPHSFLGLLGARLAGRPCVATAHGTYTIQPLKTRRHRAKALWAYRRFAAMIAVSGYTARRLTAQMGEVGGRDRCPCVIPNAVAASHYESPRALADRPWSERRFTLSIGELKERKGHHLALAAWCDVAAKRPDLHHFLVGKHGDDEYQRSLESLVEGAGLCERVHFLGNVSEDEKVDLLQRAEVFVHTPVTAGDGGFEGFGIVYLEASAAGTPVIGTTDSGSEDAVLAGRSGLLVAPERAAVAEAMSRLLDDPVLRGELGAGGIEHARACSWEHNARRVLDLYREGAP